MKFIHDELVHKPEALVGDTIDSTGWKVPVYDWSGSHKEEVL